MVWLITLLVLCMALSVTWIFVVGALQIQARDLLKNAGECISNRDFQLARDLVLRSVRLNSQYRANPDVKALYEIIVSKDASVSGLTEVRRIQAALASLPAMRTELIYRDWRFRFFLFLIVGAIVIIKFIDLYRLFHR